MTPGKPWIRSIVLCTYHLDVAKKVAENTKNVVS
jgi:hypothetical protein